MGNASRGGRGGCRLYIKFLEGSVYAVVPSLASEQGNDERLPARLESSYQCLVSNPNYQYGRPVATREVRKRQGENSRCVYTT
jgi:hypothetical protein